MRRSWGGTLLIVIGCSATAQAPRSSAQSLCQDRAYFKGQAKQNHGARDWGERCGDQQPCRVGLACFDSRCTPPPMCCADSECAYGCRDGQCQNPVPHSEDG
jgi:hypothetical protein